MLKLKMNFTSEKKEDPTPPNPEEGLVVTQEAKELGLNSSEEARLLTNFVKRHYFQEISFVSSTFYHV